MSAFRRLHAATCPVSVMSHEWAAQAARGAMAELEVVLGRRLVPEDLGLTSSDLAEISEGLRPYAVEAAENGDSYPAGDVMHGIIWFCDLDDPDDVVVLAEVARRFCFGEDMLACMTDRYSSFEQFESETSNFLSEVQARRIFDAAALLGGPRRIADYEDLNWLASESDEAIVGVLTTPRDRAAEALRESA